MKEWGLCIEEILITSRGILFTSTLRRTELMLLGLHQHIQEFGLTGHHFC
jgi:hypothetical protein